MESSDVLRGMSHIINPQNVQEGMNYEEIEKMYLGSKKTEEKENNPTESFREELKALANKLELSFDTPAAQNRSTPSSQKLFPSPIKSRTPIAKHSSVPRSSAQHDDFVSESARRSHRTPSLHDDTASASLMRPTSSRYVSFDFTTPADSRSPMKSMSPRDDEYASLPFSSQKTDDEQWDIPSERRSDASPFSRFGDSSSRKETELERKTGEQIRHEQIKGVMNEMGAQNATIFTLEQTRRQDEKLTMLDEIASLKMSLEEDEAKGIENIPHVDTKSSYEDVESVLKSYRLINDRMRYCSLADEFILWGAQGMEELFNGKRTWFGRYNPDLGGWSKQVSVKLRRMRHETSQLVGGIMHDYNIGPGARIVLELVPNMFMYARTKKQNFGKPTLTNDAEISRAISDIRNY